MHFNLLRKGRKARSFERLEWRWVLASPTSLTIPLDATLDQFGDQVLTVQAYGDASRTTFGIFDTGASAVTFSADDQLLFQLLTGGIPIKSAGGAQASGIGGDITGDVSEPGQILADGLHAASLSFDSQGFPVFNIALDGGAAADNVQAMVGTDSGSPDLPTITGTPILNPSQANPDGVAAKIDFQGETLDFSDLIPGLTLSVPDLHFVSPGTSLQTVTGVTTDPVTIPLQLFGEDNHTAPGDSITNSPSPMQPDVQLVDQSLSVGQQHMLLDTGSQLTVISTAAAHALGLDQLPPTTTIDVQGVGGTTTVPGYTLDELDLPTADGGHVAFTNVPVFVLDIAPGIDGLLGTNLWDTASSMLYDPFNPGGSPTMQLTFQLNPDRNAQLSSSDISLLGGGSADLFAGAYGGANVAVHNLPSFDVPASVTLTGTPATVTAVEGASFSGAVATFTDSDGTAQAGNFTSTIDWGDGATTAGTISSQAGGGFGVSGSHVYAEDGAESIVVAIHDAGGASVTVTTPATVSEAPLDGSGVTLSGTQGATLAAAVAVFTHPGAETAADFTATIDWGDGSTSAGSIAGANGAFSVLGSHAYADSGDFTIKVVGGEKDATATVTSSAAIATVLSPHEQYVTAVYLDVLDRTPDPPGLAHWAQRLDAGAPISSVAASIAHSNEYYANFVIRPAYLKYLGRAADDSGVAYWTAKMHAGLTDEQLEADLIASDEFYAQAGGTDVKWIDAVYSDLLGRDADSAGEAYWEARLAAGESRSHVAAGFTTSPEREQARINDDFIHYLHRPADPAGLSYWLKQFAAGKTNEDLIAGFTGSDEYYKAHTS